VNLAGTHGRALKIAELIEHEEPGMTDSSMPTWARCVVKVVVNSSAPAWARLGIGMVKPRKEGVIRARVGARLRDL